MVYGELKNEELNKLIIHKNMIRFVKARRLNLLGHMERMPEERVVKKSVIGSQFPHDQLEYLRAGGIMM
jgi:hypothetical protein